MKIPAQCLCWTLGTLSLRIQCWIVCQHDCICRRKASWGWVTPNSWLPTELPVTAVDSLLVSGPEQLLDLTMCAEDSDCMPLLLLKPSPLIHNNWLLLPLSCCMNPNRCHLIFILINPTFFHQYPMLSPWLVYMTLNHQSYNQQYQVSDHFHSLTSLSTKYIS